MTTAHFIWSVFRRHKARTIFTVLSVMTAFAIFTVLSAINQGLNGQLNFTLAQRLISYNRAAGGTPLPINYAGKIAEVPGVSAVAYFAAFNGYYRDPKNPLSVTGFSIPQLFGVYPEFTMAPAQRQAFLQDRQGAIAGEALAARMNWKVGQTIPIEGGPPQKDGGTTWYFHLDGIYHTDLPIGYQSFFVVNYQDLNEGIALAQAKDTAMQFVELASDPRDIDRIARAIDAKFDDASPQTRTRSERELTLSAIRQFGDVGAIVTYVAMAVFLSMLLIIGNTIANSVRERLGQFALMRALGFGRVRLAFFVLFESLFIVGTGAALGLAAGYGISRLLAPNVGQILQAFAVTGGAVALALGLAVLFALLASIAPTLRIARMAIVVTLREA